MLEKLHLIQTCLIILQCSNGKPSETMELISRHEQVKQQVSPLLKLLDDFKNAPNEKEHYLLKGKFQGELEMLALQALNVEMKNEMLRKNQDVLKAQKKSADEAVLFNIWRLVIDNYEESFPQPYEDDFEAKKVKYDKSKLTDHVSSHDLVEERRRQKWLFYCNNPPNKKMEDLVIFLKNETTDFDTFSRGIAKAYRLLSDKFPYGFYRIMEGNSKIYFMFKEAAIAMRLLLQHEDILDELIEKTVPMV